MKNKIECPLLLEIKDLSAGYNSIPVLEKISLSVLSGQIVSVLGANGAGKSTLMKTITGLVKPSNGTILFDSNQITGQNPEDVVKAGISYVPEGRHIFSSLTIKENLYMGAYLVKDKKQIEASIEKVVAQFPILGKRWGQKGGHLSGGEQQMLAIARALMSNPKLLLLDEPSLGIAPLVRNEIFNTITELNSQGMTIILVEQEAEIALEVCDKAYVLEMGRVAFSGSSDEFQNVEEIRRAYLGG